MAPYWAIIGKIRLIFIPTSGHTEGDEGLNLPPHCQKIWLLPFMHLMSLLFWHFINTPADTSLHLPLAVTLSKSSPPMFGRIQFSHAGEQPF